MYFCTSNTPVVPLFLLCTAISHGTNSTHVGHSIGPMGNFGPAQKSLGQAIGPMGHLGRCWAV